jgi:microsomal dipeptidase-like Zn-dependent dipeptidase
MAIKPQTADRENLAAELHKRNYPDESIGKILGGNMMRVLRTVLRAPLGV